MKHRRRKSKWLKPITMWAYRCVNSGDGIMLMVGVTEKGVRGWTAEQGPSDRIVPVKVSMLRKKTKGGASC